MDKVLTRGVVVVACFQAGAFVLTTSAPGWMKLISIIAWAIVALNVAIKGTG